MSQSQFSRNLCLAVVAAGFLAVAGCSNQPTDQAANQAPEQSNGAGQASKAAPAPNKKAAAPKAKVVPVSAKISGAAKVTEPPQPMTIPKGTAITATLGETLATDKTHQGDSFIATLSSPVILDGKTVLPKGAHLTGRVVTVKKHELKVALASISVHGKSYDLATNARRPSDQVKSENDDSAAAQDKSNDKNSGKQKKDNSTLSAKTQLTFKLTKPVTVPVKG